jgi:hypothetical protein
MRPADVRTQSRGTKYRDCVGGGEIELTVKRTDAHNLHRITVVRLTATHKCVDEISQ